ncbi:MAG TPA: uroporphyrinogen decarboxylase family protein [Rectinemataceae bacterium]|nr:uroporphyrinogen decarboxylase family protein [Rectinemataceae bacterium]
MSHTFTKRERVEAALSGEEPDRVPVSAWGHLIPAERSADTLASASLWYFREYDWDWLKVNPRATLFAEAWGSEFDFGDYRGVLPRFRRNRDDPIDYGALKPANPGFGPWAEQLASLRKIKRGIGDAPFVQTIFSPASVLSFLAARPTDHSQEAVSAAQSEALLHLIRASPEAAHHALGVIADSLAQLAAASVEAGADGIFFAITRLARQSQLTEGEFEKFGKPYDFRVLEAVRGAKFNILHSCGPRIYWKEILDYPVSALSWAAAGQGNPGLDAARADAGFALIGGLDEEGILRTGTPEQVREAASAALKLGGKRKFLLAPGCAVHPSAPSGNLRALRAVVDEGS